MHSLQGVGVARTGEHRGRDDQHRGVHDAGQAHSKQDVHSLASQQPAAPHRIIADGFSDLIEDSNSEDEDQVQNHTFWSFSEGSQAGEGRWAQGQTLVGGQDIIYQAEPVLLTDDTGLLPPPDPKLFATYDGSQGMGKPGDAAGARLQGAQNVVNKVKDALS